MHGFTLAELLISLAILGVIATFTVPKVLNAQQSQKHNSIAKEAAAAVSGAYKSYQLGTPADASTEFNDFTPFLNYVSITTTGLSVDYQHSIGAANPCNNTRPCYHLHNGAVLKPTEQSFGNTNSTNAIRFYVDPDAQHDTNANGPAKSVRFYLYYNGRLTTDGGIETGTCDSGGCRNPNSNYDPPWFNWQS